MTRESETRLAGRGFLVALEGIDGCGKSSQAHRLVQRLMQDGWSAVTFREPGASVYGDRLRKIFVEGRHVTPQEEVRLFLEDRRIDVRDNIRPALEEGKVVVMDRYYLSSVVYQGCLGLDPEQIRAANEQVAPVPDLTVILDLDVDTAHGRIRQARGGTNTFEEREYLQCVRDAYLAHTDGESILSIDASGPERDVFARLYELVRARLDAAMA